VARCSVLAARCSVLALALAIAPAARAATCERLASLSLPNTTITMAQGVAAGSFALPAARGRGGANPFADLPAFCRVAATLKPSSDSDIKMELWLPVYAEGQASQAGHWNGKYQAVGNGNWAGAINYNAMASALRRGYATSSTDTGHSSTGASFAFGHPEKLIDYAYRSEHEMTVVSKAIVGAMFGSAPSRSYWNGCSTGGRQALVEATKFPDDFDGIIAGAAANPKTHLDAWRMWMAQIAMKDDADRIPVSKYALIHQTVLAQCDALDGLKDGLLENPTKCRFDPRPIICQGSDGADCLTPRQADAARALMGPAKTPAGKAIFPGYAPGAELGWGLLLGDKDPYSVPLDQYRYIVFNNPDWDWRTFDLERDLAAAEKAGAGTLTGVNTNLSAFTKHGGKLLMYHGWADQDVPPLASVNFYESIQPKSAREGVRLFMAPGMNHCTGGEGPSVFDAVGSLERWIEHGQPPDRMVASHFTEGIVDRTRPLCAYPQTAHYKGSGDINDAENFVCK
jgi:feruloyl esterase